jgi:uncharacterized membrane protein
MTEDYEPINGEEFEEKVPITEEPMSSMDGITDDDKLWAFLAYVFTPIVPIILMLMEDKKNRPFIKAHNAQALAWGVVNLVGGTILSSVLFFCLGAPSIIIWAVGVYWGWQAYQGQAVTIPFITDFVKKQGWA